MEVKRDRRGSYALGGLLTPLGLYSIEVRRDRGEGLFFVVG
jgi:hypothetical protein